MTEIEIRNIVLGMVSTNCYLVMNRDTKDTLLIDPADSPEQIEQQLLRMGGSPAAVLLTHGHFDHMMAADACRRQYEIPVYVHEKEEVVLENARLNLSALWTSAYTMKADQLVREGDVLELAGLKIQAYHTPGHTQGSVCYYLPEQEVLFSGDTIFAQSYGRTDFPTSSSRQMEESIKRILSEFPDETRIYPGHNEQTTIAIEKRYNPLA